MRLHWTLRDGSVVIIAGRTAVKRYRGKGARVLLARQRIGYESAVKCTVWRSLVVPMQFGPFSLAFSPAGSAIPDDDGGTLVAFVDDLVSRALHAGRWSALEHLIPLNELAAVLEEAGATALFKNVESSIQRIVLPVGPTHGDLHRGNLVLLRSGTRVIDFDRFRPAGCPLFDLLHFHLSEVQRGTGLRWLEVLRERSDLTVQAANGMVPLEELNLSYGLQRIAHEGYAARLQGRELAKYVLQTKRVLEAFLQPEMRVETA